MKTIDLYPLSPVQWAPVPTPINHHDLMSEDLGVDLYLKREDLIDDVGSGHKARKLQFLLADVQKVNATIILSAGSTQSNQCRTLAIAGRRFGHDVHLIFTGDEQKEPQLPTGNYLLTKLFEPTITWVEKTSWQQVDRLLYDFEEKLIKQGQQPYVIPPGASKWPGLLGSIELGFELADQIKTIGINPDYIIAAAGSCGTCVGLQIAGVLMRTQWQVIGICIAGSAREAFQYQAQLLEEAHDELGIPDVLSAKAWYYDGACGPGYDKHSSNEIALLQSTLVRYQQIFDPNYMLRTFNGLRHLLDDGTIPKGSCIVLVHSGGQFGLFSDTSSLINYWKNNL
jgi:1-aminocyclopropane-1-carboxylate deaminase/D-cysteine desulfhydrase-like pyridoxal-dependent ACC family enzyme